MVEVLTVGTLQLGVVSEGRACADGERVEALGRVCTMLEDVGGPGWVCNGETGVLGRGGMVVGGGRPARMGSVLGFNTMPL